MISRLTLSETDTFDEVNKAINMLIDSLNLIEDKVCQITEGLSGPKKTKKKGGK